MDIAFVIDSSGSIGSRNWERIKRYVKSVVSKFEIGSSAARMAIIVYSTNPQVALLFRNFQSTDMVNKVLDDMRWRRGLTFTDKALLLAASSVFLASNGMRSNVTKVRSVCNVARALIDLSPVFARSSKVRWPGDKRWTLVFRGLGTIFHIAVAEYDREGAHPTKSILTRKNANVIHSVG